MRRHAHRLVAQGMSAEDATDMAIDHWRASLKRAQMIVQFNAELRSRGKPTLHVSLFEAAKLR